MNNYEQKLYRVVLMSGRPVTTSQITEHTGFSWNTCNKNLESLYVKGKIRKEKLSNRTYWFI